MNVIAENTQNKSHKKKHRRKKRRKTRRKSGGEPHDEFEKGGEVQLTEAGLDYYTGFNEHARYLFGGRPQPDRETAATWRGRINDSQASGWDSDLEEERKGYVQVQWPRNTISWPSGVGRMIGYGVERPDDAQPQISPPINYIKLAWRKPVKSATKKHTPKKKKHTPKKKKHTPKKGIYLPLTLLGGKRRKTRKKRGGAPYKAFHVGDRVVLSERGRAYYTSPNHYHTGQPGIPLANWVGTVSESRNQGGIHENKGYVSVQWPVRTELKGTGEVTYKDMHCGDCNNVDCSCLLSIKPVSYIKLQGEGENLPVAQRPPLADDFPDVGRILGWGGGRNRRRKSRKKPKSATKKGGASGRRRRKSRQRVNLRRRRSSKKLKRKRLKYKRRY